MNNTDNPHAFPPTQWSLVLAVKHDTNWLWFTAFVGANLLQSAFTGWCPMVTILEKAGLRRQAA